jgi:hypothetical protein
VVVKSGRRHHSRTVERAAQPRAIRPGAIQNSLKAPNRRLDRQLRRASYIAIRQLSNVRAAPATGNVKDFQRPGVKVFNPFAESESQRGLFRPKLVGLPNGGKGAAEIPL